MSMNIKDAQKPTGSFGLAKEGTQVGVLAQLINLGKQKRKFKGKDKPPGVQLNFTFELPNDKITTEDDEVLPRWISKNRVNFVGGENAALTALVAALDPDGSADGELDALVGRGVLVNIKHQKKSTSDDLFAKIEGLTPMIEGMETPALNEPPVVFNFYEPDIAVYQNLAEWVRDIIKEAVDFPGSELEKLIAAHGETAPEDEADVVADSGKDIGDDEDDSEDRPY